MFPLPVREDSLNLRALARVEREDFTGVVGATVTLAQNPVEAAAPPGTSVYVDVYKNGALMHNIASADYTVAGKVVTFAVALVVGDKITIFYWARAN
jgi:hypothetical protein